MDIEIDAAVLAKMLAHAEREAPRECCGLLVSIEGALVYREAKNLMADAEGDRFMLDPADWVATEEEGRIMAVVHSHPNASANPSMADRVGCERSGLPWVIVGWPSGMVKQLQPDGWAAPYKGREFHHGVLDCYTLVQDWYRRELAIELPDYERDDGWWEEREGQPAQDLYMNQFASAGFVRVFGEPQRHDGILMEIRSERANHAAVYLGDGVILHHLHGRPSEETLYGHFYQNRTVALVRHISRISPMEAQVTAMRAAA